MTYSPSYRPAGEGPELNTVDATVTVKAGPADTEGTYGVFEVDMPRGPVVPAHREPWAKAFYVLAGRISVQAGEHSYELEPGAFLTIPPDTVNTITVDSATAKFLAFSLGSGMNDFFVEVDRTAARGASIDELLPVMLDVTARNGIVFDQPGVPS